MANIITTFVVCFVNKYANVSKLSNWSGGKPCADIGQVHNAVVQIQQGTFELFGGLWFAPGQKSVAQCKEPDVSRGNLGTREVN